MLIKFHLIINGSDVALGDDCVKNWDDVKCSWKRKEKSGVVRSFTSKFDFVGKAAALIRGEYFRKETNGDATIVLYAIGNDWQYKEVFRCPLDFTTYSEANHIVSISAIDNSIAATIKAKQSTVYEFALTDEGETYGKRIEPDGVFHFDRIPMRENVRYALLCGEQQNDGSVIIDTDGDMGQAAVCLTKMEGDVCLNNITVNDAVPFMIFSGSMAELKSDDAVITAWKNMIAHVEYDFSYSALWSAKLDEIGRPMPRTIFMRSDIYNPKKNQIRMFMQTYELECIGWYDYGSYATFTEAFGSEPSETGCYVTLQDNWPLNINNGSVQHCHIGGKLYKASIINIERPVVTFTYTWQFTEMPHDVDYYENIRYTYSADWSLYDGDLVLYYFLANTKIGTPVTSRLAYIQNLKIINSSFKFNWIASGDVVDIPTLSPQLMLTSLADAMMPSGTTLLTQIDSDDARVANTRLMAAESVRGIPAAKAYTSFSAFCDWMEAVFGYTYQLEEAENGTLLHFMHRSKLFNKDADVVIMDEVNEVSYSVDASMVYSSMEIGYEKKDYDNINGRDEFNFSCIYNTNSVVTDKRLQLLSKYRADGYGIEFAVQKRGEDTTDSESDQDVFFVLVKSDGYPDRSVPVTGSLNNGRVINAAFSPLACIEANKGTLSAQALTMKLSFASGAGNTEVSIGGVPIKSDHTLSGRLFTPGLVKFVTNELGAPANINDIVEIENNNIRYKGFVNDVELRIGKPQSTEYNIIVKDMIAL